MPSITRLVPALVIAGFLLAGCDPLPPEQPPPTTATAPRFASDEEALAAAEKAYAAYLATSDQIVRDGGRDDARLEPFLSDELFASEQAGFAKMREEGERGIGYTTFTMTLQKRDNVSITAYACVDISHTDLIDAQGNSTVESDRRLRLPFEVEFDTESMRILRTDFWGDREC